MKFLKKLIRLVVNHDDGTVEWQCYNCNKVNRTEPDESCKYCGAA